MAQKATHHLSAARYDVPAQYVNEVGRIVVRFTYFEHYLQAIIWDLARVDQSVGRLTIRSLAVGESIDLIRDLFALRGMSIKSEMILSFRARALEISRRRDLLVHGAWLRGADRRWRVIKIKIEGSHNALSPDMKDQSKQPAMTVKIDELRAIASGIDTLIKWARSLLASVRKSTAQRALPASMPSRPDADPSRQR